MNLIDGKKIAAELRNELKVEVILKLHSQVEIKITSSKVEYRAEVSAEVEVIAQI